MSGRAANIWISGTVYPPGSVVRPSTNKAPSPAPLLNPSFATGNFTGWNANAKWQISTTSPYTDTYSAKLPPNSGSNVSLTNQSIQPAKIGLAPVTATCFVNFGNDVGSFSTNVGVQLMLLGLDNANNITEVMTTVETTPILGFWGWYKLSVVGTPTQPNTTKITAAIIGRNTDTTRSVYVDEFYWDYLAQPATIPQIYYAVQPSGTLNKSGNTEPIWRDTTTGGNIVDGDVQWTSAVPTAIVWQARPLLQAGISEPVWPTLPGQFVHDGTIDWEAITPRVQDQNDPTLPPGSKFVIAAASKIFVLDGDIARYCGTMNPLDWTSEQNAGFLPIGQRAYGTNPFTAAGIYRSNAVFMNAEGAQMWQVDEDPANMALLDAIPVGCTQHRSIASVNDDMLFLSSQGVRSMGISAGSSNLQAGDVGMPIDPLVKAALRAATSLGIEPIGSYYPALGQYFLAFPDWDGTDGNGNSLFWSAAGKGSTNNGSGNNYVVNIKGARGPLRDGVFYRIQYDRTSTAKPTLTICDENGVSIDASQPKTLNGNGTPDVTALSTTWVQYYSVLNQFFTTTNQTRLFVYTMGRTGEVGSWSNYLLQFTLESFCQSGDNLYMRGVIAGQPQVFMFDPDDTVDSSSSGNFPSVFGVVQWPWLDDGQPGVTKQLSGFDLAVTMSNQSIPNALNYTVEIGYDQTNKTRFTVPYTMAGDTVPGMIVPIQVKAPSFSMRVVFDCNSGWSLQAATLYLTDKRIGS